MNEMILPDWTAYLIIFWSVFLFVWNIVLILYLNPKRTRNLISQIWNDKIELEDLNGEVIKVPITKIVKDKEGNEVEHTEMVVGPLWYTIMWGLGTMAADRVKMSILSAKGKVARQFNSEVAAADLAAAGFSVGEMALLEQAPAKIRPFLLIAAKWLKSKQGQGAGGSEAFQTMQSPLR